MFIIAYILKWNCSIVHILLYVTFRSTGEQLVLFAAALSIKIQRQSFFFSVDNC